MLKDKKYITKRIQMGSFGRIINLVLDVEEGGRYTYIEKENNKNKNKKVDFNFFGHSFNGEGKKVLEKS